MHPDPSRVPRGGEKAFFGNEYLWRIMIRIGNLIGLATGVLLLGATGAGLWYWNDQNTPAGAAAASAPSGAQDSDSALAARVAVLHDSLQVLDAKLRLAQVNEAEPPLDLVQTQAGLWERYTWARSRLSDAVDAGAPAPAAVNTGIPAPVASTPDSSGELGVMLGHLATYLWILAGVGALAVAILAWLLFFRRGGEATPSRPLTEPTLRHDRNVRMQVPRPEETLAPVREPTFTQMRQARATATELDDDIPAAPMPRTGRHAWENTVSQPQPQMAPSEPTAVQDYVVSMAKRGRTPAEIARRLRIPQDQVDLILKLRRNS